MEDKEISSHTSSIIQRRVSPKYNRGMNKRVHPPLPEDDVEIRKNFIGTTLTAIAVKIYNAMLRS